MSESELFCKSCGNKLQPDSVFCPKCGASTKGLTPAPAITSGKIGGVDKRVLIAIGIILLVLLVPVFPRDKIVYVSGQTTTTQLYQSTSFQTSLQAYSTMSQQSVQVYAGTLVYVQNQYYNYYTPYFSGCIRTYYGYIRCGSYYSWPNYNLYTTTVTVNPNDNVVNVQDTQQSNGYLSTVTLTKADGSTVIYSNVLNDNLSQAGTSNVQVVVTQTSTVTQTTMVPATTVTSVACNNCVPQHVTEHVSLLQLLLRI